MTEDMSVSDGEVDDRSGEVEILRRTRTSLLGSLVFFGCLLYEMNSVKGVNLANLVLSCKVNDDEASVRQDRLRSGLLDVNFPRQDGTCEDVLAFGKMKFNLVGAPL